MKLEQWIGLEQKEKHRLISEWSKDVDAWFRYEELAWSAAKLLLKSLTDRPEVTNIDLGGGSIVNPGELIPITEKTLNVLTMHADTHDLEMIPTNFLGFNVKQTNLHWQRLAYLNTWKRILKELKGWDESTTLKWAEKWDDALSGRQLSEIYHYGAVEKAAYGIVLDTYQPSEKKPVGLLIIKLRNLISSTEQDPSTRIFHPDQIPDYDWDYVRREMNKLFKEFESS